MKFIYYTFLVTSIIFVSCKRDTEQSIKTDPRLNTPFTQQTAAAIETAEQPAQQQHNLFNENSSVSTPSVAAGINPAHGAPNHRCDIEVGAPLNSVANEGSVTTQSTPMQVQPQTQTIKQPIISKTATPKGMNPAHGETGHRCDIAVGAPLNSKPVATPTSANKAASSGQVNNQFTVEQPVPALLSTNSTDTKTAKGMNPPHGQAGHQCGIAVGAALPKN